MNEDKRDQSEESITTLASRDVYMNPWMRVHEDEILRSNGHRGIYGVVEKDDAAIILPIEPEHDGGKGRVWLVEQYRYTVKERCVELPQGGWEMGEVDAEELARGELREELGLEAESMVYLGFNWIAYGFTRQKHHVFVASGLSHTEKDPDPEEHDIEVRTATVDEFEAMMLDGRIRDNCTLAAWAMYLVWKRRRDAVEA
ncbi:MAG TPA: NUDIX hydrolase [Acidobacteriaceae bacterium]